MVNKTTKIPYDTSSYSCQYFKIIHHIKEGPVDEPGFYFMMCSEYDKSLKISHTNRAKKIFKIPRNVEPDIIKIFDFNVQMEQS